MRRASQYLNSPPSRALRWAVVLLALLQIVAPLWHVCALGGHAMASDAAAHHGTVAIPVQSDGPRRPLICWCPPSHDADPNSGGPKFSPVVSHEDHGTCLALLLQTMPGALAAAPTIALSSTKVESRFPIRHERAPTLAILRRFRGRAPPAFA